MPSRSQCSSRSSSVRSEREYLFCTDAIGTIVAELLQLRDAHLAQADGA